MPSDLEEQTRKKGNLWAHELKSQLKQSAREKLHHLEKITNDHLTWFDQHNTIEKLIQSKRPLDVTTAIATTPAAKRVRKNDNPLPPSPPQTSDRSSTGSDASMKTASEMNEEIDQVQLVQPSHRHHIISESSSSTLRHSASFCRSSSNSLLQPQSQSSTNQTSNKKLSNLNKTTATKEGEENHDSDSDGMDPDLYPTKIPDWAMSPELMEKLKLQKSMVGDKIFGGMAPMEMSVIFGNHKRNRA